MYLCIAYLLYIICLSVPGLESDDHFNTQSNSPTDGSHTYNIWFCGMPFSEDIPHSKKNTFLEVKI